MLLRHLTRLSTAALFRPECDMLRNTIRSSEHLAAQALDQAFHLRLAAAKTHHFAQKDVRCPKIMSYSPCRPGA